MNNYNLINNDPLALLVNKSLLSLPTPLSISFMWNIGFMLGICLTLQIITGIILSINYVSQVDLSFDSVIHIIRDVEIGAITRYTHINGASLFFIIMFMHIARGIYFNSPINNPIVWASGVIILLLTIGTAFIGYVLPWGQISFWGATVITSIISAIPYVGNDVTQWVWGNFSVSQPTLNRFFSLHYLIPIIILVIVIIHLMLLHQNGSSNPTGTVTNYDNINFFPYFLINDTIPMIIAAITMLALISTDPNNLGDVENFNNASISTTPPHIQPEWYFLFAYAILRSIPSNLGGVVAIVCSVLVLLTLCLNDNNLNKKFAPINNTSFWVLVSLFFMLTWIGANPVEPPFISIGIILSGLYFLTFIVV